MDISPRTLPYLRADGSLSFPPPLATPSYNNNWLTTFVLYRAFEPDREISRYNLAGVLLPGDCDAREDFNVP